MRRKLAETLGGTPSDYKWSERDSAYRDRRMLNKIEVNRLKRRLEAPRLKLRYRASPGCPHENQPTSRGVLERCDSSYVPDEPWLDDVFACNLRPGHTGLHEQGKAGGHPATTWTDAEAVRNRCPSHSPEAHARTQNEDPVYLRCAREAGHAGVYSMVVLRPYGRADQIDWHD
jgi:hypothetical protein